MAHFCETGSEVNCSTCATTSSSIANDHVNDVVCDTTKTLNNGHSIHPLLVELILENILDLLPLEDLKNARVVCYYWNLVCTPLLKKKAPEISFNEDNYWTNATNHRIDAMKDFTMVVESSTNFPFVKFDVGTSVISFLHEDTVNSFFTVCSPVAEELTIRDEGCKRIFRSGYPKKLTFPRLHTLCLHLLQTDGNLQYFFGFVQEIMQVSPALKKLILINHNGTDEGDVVSQMISVLRRTPVNHLIDLVLEAHMNQHHLTSLSRMNLRLQSLSFDFWGSSITAESMSEFLSSQRKTLKYLKVGDTAMSTGCQIEFPRMERLKTLKIKGSMLGRITVTFPKVSYTQQFPKLEKLSLCELFGEWEEFLAPSIKPTVTVQELKLPSDFADDLCLRRAASIFPKLKKLEVPAYPEILETVYEVMGALEELVINTRYASNIDSIITGFPSAICQRLLVLNCSNTLDEVKDFIVTKPITCLTKLNKLRLKCKRSSDLVEITNVSCFYALLNMPQLQVLDLGSRPNQLTERCLAAMSEKFCVLL